MDHDQLLRLRQNRRQVAQPELISRPDDYLFQLRERHGDGLYPPAARRVIVTENKINGLALPELADTLAIFGLGYGIQTLAEVPWLKDKALYYWGDIDTHGLNILAMARAICPHTRALLMDQATLLQYRDLWSREDTPAPADQRPADRSRARPLPGPAGATLGPERAPGAGADPLRHRPGRPGASAIVRSALADLVPHLHCRQTQPRRSPATPSPRKSEYLPRGPS